MIRSWRICPALLTAFRPGLFHRHLSQAGKGEGGATDKPTPEMIDRLVLPMSNVCVACLREGIVEDADIVDGAMIFGTGYAPFRGGPLNYARTRGVENVVEALRGLAAKFGDRFAPDEGWASFR